MCMAVLYGPLVRVDEAACSMPRRGERSSTSLSPRSDNECTSASVSAKEWAGTFTPPRKVNVVVPTRVELWSRWSVSELVNPVNFETRLSERVPHLTHGWCGRAASGSESAVTPFAKTQRNAREGAFRRFRSTKHTFRYEINPWTWPCKYISHTLQNFRLLS